MTRVRPHSRRRTFTRAQLVAGGAVAVGAMIFVPGAAHAGRRQEPPVSSTTTSPSSAPELCPEHPQILKDKTGDCVTLVQRRLMSLGFGGSETGRFDVDTENRVCRFQSGAKLPVDGIVGPGTWKTLLNASSSPQGADCAGNPGPPGQTPSATDSSTVPPTDPPRSTVSAKPSPPETGSERASGDIKRPSPDSGLSGSGWYVLGFASALVVFALAFVGRSLLHRGPKQAAGPIGATEALRTPEAKLPAGSVMRSTNLGIDTSWRASGTPDARPEAGPPRTAAASLAWDEPEASDALREGPLATAAKDIEADQTALPQANVQQAQHKGMTPRTFSIVEGAVAVRAISVPPGLPTDREHDGIAITVLDPSGIAEIRGGLRLAVTAVGPDDVFAPGQAVTVHVLSPKPV